MFDHWATNKNMLQLSAKETGIWRGMRLKYTISYSFWIGVSMKCHKKICEEQIKSQKCNFSIRNHLMKIICMTILSITYHTRLVVRKRGWVLQYFFLSGRRRTQEVIMQKSPNFSEYSPPTLPLKLKKFYYY